MLGKPVPDFSVPSTGGSPFRLSDARGTQLVLYFHPKDNDSYAAFQKAATQVYGISRDTLKSHARTKRFASCSASSR